MRKDEITPDEMLDALRTIEQVCRSHYSAGKFQCKKCPYYFEYLDLQGNVVQSGCAIQNKGNPADWQTYDVPKIRMFD